MAQQIHKRKFLQYLGCGTIVGMSGCLGSITGGQCGPGEDPIDEITENYDSYLREEGEIEGETVGSYSTGPDVSTLWISIRDPTGRATVVIDDPGERDIPANECFRVTGTVAPLEEVRLASPTDDIALIDANLF